MKKIILLYIIFISTGNCFGQQITFQKEFGDSGNSKAFSLSLTFDGNYVIAGHNISSGSKIFLIKLNVNGDTIWTKTYEPSTLTKCYDAKQTFDKGFIVTGTVADSLTRENIFLLKTDSIGTIIWFKVFGETKDDRPYSVQQTPDSGFVLTGYTTSFNYPNVYAFLTKTDMNGNILWNKQIAYNNFMYGFSLELTNDNGYILTGSLDEGNGYSDVCLIKTDSLGNIMWSKKYGNDSLDDVGYSVKQISDGGFIIAGNVFTYLGTSQQEGHIYLFKTDINGNLIWEKKFEGCCTEQANSAIETYDKGFIIAGGSNSFVGNGLYTTNAYLLKTDSIGIVQWCKYYGSPANSDDEALSVKQTADSGYIFSGITQNNIGYVAYLVKTDSLGNTECHGYGYTLYDSIYTSASSSFNCITTTPAFGLFSQSINIGSFNCNNYDPCSTGIIELKDYLKITISPNPTTTNFTITFPATIYKGTIDIYTVFGENIYSENITNVSQKEIYLKNIGAGIYFVKVSDGEKEYSKNLVIQ